MSISSSGIRHCPSLWKDWTEVTGQLVSAAISAMNSLMRQKAGW